MFIAALCISQKVETTQMSINGWMGKQIVVYPHSGMLFSHKKEWSSDTCYNMYEPHTKWKKTETKLMYCMIPFHLYEISGVNP